MTAKEKNDRNAFEKIAESLLNAHSAERISALPLERHLSELETLRKFRLKRETEPLFMPRGRNLE
ncbi:hypothetical protein [Ferviditalea candida]|uniref:Uncharacterized protein n=1 Tax=Ferviditalea candida TaxID=3108399 RepID=A0ABU5ZC50_9BACL|nr:hypothetical protein [Paenibacillaceae bacterium T2]